MQQDKQKLKSSTEAARGEARRGEAGQVGHATSRSRSAVHFLYMQQTYLQIGAYLTLINTELH